MRSGGTQRERTPDQQKKILRTRERRAASECWRCHGNRDVLTGLERRRNDQQTEAKGLGLDSS